MRHSPILRFAALVVAFLMTGTSAEAQRLFRATSPVEVTFTVSNMRLLLRERDSTVMKPHTATMSFSDSGKAVTIPVTLRARGHFRRQQRNCDFPPIRWDAKKADVNGTLFQGLTQMKLTTTCRPGNEDYDQYIFAEYAAYRAYALISPIHYRTRLVHIVYKDSAKAEKDVTSWGFFIEHDADMAKQNKLKLLTTKGALWDDVDEQQTMRTTLFEYMIGNTDVSVSALHNITLVRDSVSLALYPIAYDFDFSGLVNTRYATPDARLGIKRVTERLHRGPCKPLETWKPIFAEFQKQRAAIDSVYGTIPQMKPARAKDAKDYLKDFWETIANDRAAKREIVDVCQKQGM